MAIGEFKLDLQSRNAQFYVKINDFCAVWPWNLTDDLENNKAPLLCHIKLCASFHRYTWIQPGVKVRKRLNWVLTSVTLTFDLWSLPLAWTSLLSRVITPAFRNPQSVLGNVIIFIFQLLKVTWQKRIYVIGEQLYGTIFFHEASILTFQKLCLLNSWNIFFANDVQNMSNI